MPVFNKIDFVFYSRNSKTNNVQFIHTTLQVYIEYLNVDQIFIILALFKNNFVHFNLNSLDIYDYT